MEVLKMKIFTYEFDVVYGTGQGIVCADDEQKAIELIKENDGYYKEYNLKYEKNHDIILTEIELKNNDVISYSYTE